MAKISNVFSKEEVKKTAHPKRITKWIHYTKLTRNEKQYCDTKDIEEIEGLADLIEASGMVLQDLLVKKLDSDEYQIIAGHKRCAACKLLVEERGKKEFEFLPCFEQNISDVRAEFQVYSTNCHHEETPYETMHKLERMQYLINNYPDEFPEIQGGRMVDRLAKKYNLSKSTVGEYLSISKNLGDTAMEAFEKGEIDKSAAVTLASMPEEKQNQALAIGCKTDKALKKYKKEGYFVYVNHTQPFADTFIPSNPIYPKKNFFIVNPENVSMKFVGNTVQMLGAIPIPSNKQAMKNFLEAIRKHIEKNHSITIYPEAHIWPYYTKIRPFKDVSFKYPIQLETPTFCMTNTYQKYGKNKIKIVTYIDGPFFPNKELTKKEQQKELRDTVYNYMVKRSQNSNIELIKYIKKSENSLK